MPVNPTFLMYLYMKPFTIPITLTNSQSSATPAPFQQLINIDPSTIGSSYFSSDLGNIRFYADSAFTQPLYAWVESGNSNTSTSTNIWVNLPNGVPANSSITIYIKLLSVGTEYDGVYMGEAPQLSPTYGQYDNGASVFNFYDNFAGTTLNTNKWTSGTNNGTIVVNNGIHLYTTTGGGSAGISFATAQTTNNLIREAALNLYGSSGSDIRDRVNPGLPGESISDFGYYTTSSYTNQAVYFVKSSSTGVTTPVFSSAMSPLILDSQAYTSTGNIYWNSYNYGNYGSAIYSTSGTFTAGSTYTAGYAATLDAGGCCESSEYIYFVRIRAYPPNGVMPTVSLL